ncbi:MAG: methyl-accepting chemotaxis protein [Alphaproteobacteria bacterium]
MIAGLSAMLVALLLVVSGFGFAKTMAIGREIGAVSRHGVPLTNAIASIRREHLEEALAFQRALRMGHLMASDPAGAGSFAGARARLGELSSSVDQLLVDGLDLARQAAAGADGTTQRSSLWNVVGGLETAARSHTAFAMAAENTLRRIENGPGTGIENEVAGVEAARERLSSALARVGGEVEGFKAETLKTAEDYELGARRMIAFVSVMSVIIAALASLTVRGRIVAVIRALTNDMALLARGNLDVEVGGGDRRDEIGEMARAVGVFRENAIAKQRLEAEEQELAERATQEKRALIDRLACDFEASVLAVMDSVSDASVDMRTSAESMATTAEHASQRATAVSAASEQASLNVQTVASAAEELSASIGEIGRQASQSSNTALRAVTEAEQMNTQVQGLSEAAQKIGEIVNLINEIASQTNLLALNATIEAARAGAAGKGFAVVASEVKALASETAAATEQIAGQILEMQAVTEASVGVITQIGMRINEIAESTAAIAAAVEEQDAATRDIALNVQQAARGTQDVDHNIGGVSHAAAETGTAANQVLAAAGQLSQQSAALHATVDAFLREIRAA